MSDSTVLAASVASISGASHQAETGGRDYSVSGEASMWMVTGGAASASSLRRSSSIASAVAFTISTIPGRGPVLRLFASSCRLLAGEFLDERAAASLRTLADEYDEAADAAEQCIELHLRQATGAVRAQ
jgi:hypothetical protein